MHLLTNIFAIAGVAWTVVGALTLALFLVPAYRDGHRERRFMRQECADLKALDDPAAMDVALRKTGSEGAAA